ncbi:S26 family signal peptidase [Salinirarus marinus]|uniref:S26 family signal peptidase n=1 Tax=Salinirarus marinus TaxID=3068310 RepID=UPI003C6C3B32
MSSDDGRRPPEQPSGESSADLLGRLRTAERGPLMVVREFVVSVTAVAFVGLLLFSISGIWPPMVAVESGSMEPHMHRGDLVFVTEPGRFAPDAAHGDTGVVTHRNGERVGYRKFGGYGSVVVYDTPGSNGAPIIHRARFWVEKGENWYGKADESYLGAESCSELPNCPAPNAGFITKGDNNPSYDQVNGIAADPIRPEWITGVARVRIPYLGWIRLAFAGVTTDAPMWAGVSVDRASLVAVDRSPAAT